MKPAAWLSVMGAAGWLAAASAAPAPGMDCPLATQPYSSRTLLIDLTINPATRAILERDAPQALEPFGSDVTLPPGFATIITPEWILSTRADSKALIPRLDAELAKVPVTAEATRARCARYDTTPPTLPRDIRRPAILVFDKITGFRDAPSVDAATAALKGIGERRRWTLVFSDNGAVFNAADLARFDAVVWNNISGDALTVPQREAFRTYIERGGGFAGFHGSGGDPVYLWDWYADTLIGARFNGHPMNPQFQQARVVVSEPVYEITQGLGSEWTMTEEWYSFKASPRSKGVHVLATLDESSYSPVGFGGQDIRMGDHPIAWAQCIGDGRSFYSAIGHRPESYTEPHSLKLLEQGIAWAAGLGKTRCASGSETH
jgi:type 1 glutamine amidotransferase